MAATAPPAAVRIVAGAAAGPAGAAAGPAVEPTFPFGDWPADHPPYVALRRAIKAHFETQSLVDLQGIQKLCSMAGAPIPFTNKPIPLWHTPQTSEASHPGRSRPVQLTEAAVDRLTRCAACAIVGYPKSLSTVVRLVGDWRRFAVLPDSAIGQACERLYPETLPGVPQSVATFIRTITAVMTRKACLQYMAEPSPYLFNAEELFDVIDGMTAFLQVESTIIFSAFNDLKMVEKKLPAPLDYVAVTEEIRKALP